MTKARDLSKLLSTANGKIAGANLDVSFENISDTGTAGTKVASGTTGQRGSTAGQIRFNTTTGLAEYYTGTDFKVIDSPPTVTVVSPLEVASDAGGNITFTITGSNFQSGAVVKFIANDATELTASTTTVTNSTTISAVIARSSFVGAKEPYDVRVINTSGLSAVLDNQINVDVSPVWSTASGNIANILDDSTGTHATVSATDADGDTVSYSETGGTVLTTAGLTLNSSTGAISGDPTNVASNTTYSFTLRATANSKTTDRTFNIIVGIKDGSTSAKANTSAKAIKTLTGTTTSGLYWLKPTGFIYPAQFYCEMNYYGGGWTYIIQQQVVNTAGLSWNSSYTGTQNDVTSAFRGVQDNNGGTHTVDTVWNGIVGAGNLASIYVKETQTSGGTYPIERQAYTNSSDNPILDFTNFKKLFGGFFGSGTTGIKVGYNNGVNSVTGKQITTWGDLVTINDGGIDTNLFYNNGNGVDGNWSFGLMRGGTPFPGNANSDNGGSRNSVTRWATFAIRE